MKQIKKVTNLTKEKSDQIDRNRNKKIIDCYKILYVLCHKYSNKKPII
jgi:hypothetical protein